jgi:hypothetical protein
MFPNDCGRRRKLDDGRWLLSSDADPNCDRSLFSLKMVFLKLVSVGRVRRITLRANMCSICVSIVGCRLIYVKFRGIS